MPKPNKASAYIHNVNAPTHPHLQSPNIATAISNIATSISSVDR